MDKAQVKQAWESWQQEHAEEAAQIRHTFADTAIREGFARAEHSLCAAIANRIPMASYANVQDALA